MPKKQAHLHIKEAHLSKYTDKSKSPIYEQFEIKPTNAKGRDILMEKD